MEAAGWFFIGLVIGIGGTGALAAILRLLGMGKERA